jgi:hypothetical protein
MSDYTIQAVTSDAQRAAKLGHTILDACPHPWFTPEGKLWRKVYRAIVEAKEAA